MVGTAVGFDQSMPDLIDRQNMKLTVFNQVIYFKCNMTSDMWSIYSAFIIHDTFLQDTFDYYSLEYLYL